MRAFRYRLASYQRIKRHKIEEAEQEIARLESEVQKRFRQIEEGRRRLAEFQRFYMEEVPEIHSSEIEATEAAFRGYTFLEEARRFREIEDLRRKQEKKRKELVTLYQEEKMLERLKDRQYEAWQKEEQRQDIYLLDEMGGQAYLRKQKPSGGAMLIVLGLVALIGAAGGILVALGKHHTVLQRFGLEKPAAVASATAEVAVAPSIPGQYDIKDLYGDPDRPANVVLNEMMEMSQTLRQRRQEAREEQERLEAERKALEEGEKQLEDRLGNLESKINELKRLREEERERLASMHMQRVSEVSGALQRMKPKGAADLLTEMWKIDPAEDPDARDIVLDVFRSIPSAKRNKILDALVKSSKTETADMVLKFVELEPVGTPAAAPSTTPVASAAATPVPTPAAAPATQ
ncbi:MAG TPA: hypothetical protein PLG59_11905 [bacterium]|nr:hypothetical protein [bacterium]HQP99738.1 hypothetical protein [bacterium]